MSTAEPCICAACQHADELEGSVIRGRCGWRGGLEPGPIVELYKAPPRGCPLRAFAKEQT